MRAVLARLVAVLTRGLRSAIGGWLYPLPPDTNRDIQRCPGCGNSEEWYMPYCRVCGRALDGYYRRAQEEFRALQATGAMNGVEVLPQRDACPPCRSLAGQVYAPGEMPRLPYPHCTHPKGCRCSYVAVGLHAA